MLCLDYELVRRYHPDSPFARSLPPDMAHIQFQAVSRAYDVLRGRKASMAVDGSDDGPTSRPNNDVGFEIWKARQARKADIDVVFDERWKDKMLVGIMLFVRCLSTLYHSGLTHPLGYLLFRCSNRVDPKTKDRSGGQGQGFL